MIAVCGTRNDLWAELVIAVKSVRTVPDGLEITPSVRLSDDLGFDSIGLLNLVFLLEDRFDRNFVAALRGEAFVTLGDAHDWLAERLGEQASGCP